MLNASGRLGANYNEREVNNARREGDQGAVTLTGAGWGSWAAEGWGDTRRTGFGRDAQTFMVVSVPFSETPAAMI